MTSVKGVSIHQAPRYAHCILDLLSRAERYLKRQVVRILVLHVLADPKDDRAAKRQNLFYIQLEIAKNTSNIPKANQGIADNIFDAHSQRRHADARYDKLEYKDSHTSSHTTGQSCEAKEQHDTSLPRDTGTAVAEGVGAKTLFLDRIDDEHSQAGEDEGKPVNELDVDVGGVGVLGPDGRVEHDVEGERELRMVSDG